jgi:hypothetical protein
MSAEGQLKPSNQHCLQSYVSNELVFPELYPVCINTDMCSSNTKRYTCMTDLACQIEETRVGKSAKANTVMLSRLFSQNRTQVNPFARALFLSLYVTTLLFNPQTPYKW